LQGVGRRETLVELRRSTIRQGETAGDGGDTVRGIRRFDSGKEGPTLKAVHC
jgi:hypothetical protein